MLDKTQGVGGAVEMTASTTAPKKLQDADDGAKFGEVWKQIQGKYGARPEKPREIKKQLGKDDFLKLMITQMKNQDPTQPFKAEQFAADMAQFASVEQLKNISQSVEKLGTQNQPLERLAMTNLIGKNVTIDRERFNYTQGENTRLTFQLSKDADQTVVSVVSPMGETVWQADAGSMKAGENSVLWDGKKDNSLPAASGAYMIRVEAKDSKGATIPTLPKAQVRVIGVSFEGSEPVLLAGNPAQPEKIPLQNVSRIEDTGPLVPGAVPFSQPVGAPPLAEPSTKQNFFTFKKGVGSQNLDPSQLPPEAQAALQGLQSKTETAEKAPVAYDDGEKGFPSGLSEESADLQAPPSQSSLVKGGNEK